ncbi:MAG TPA: hypothetical protein VKV26_17230 [Dehalococcoidia bacterium]|nr:hypothetical protein [Dehalococcoidia bacterium]
MSLEVMVDLAKEAARDLSAQRRYEALSDDELARLGLSAEDVASIRDGFFDRVQRLGLSLDPAPSGCCT